MRTARTILSITLLSLGAHADAAPYTCANELGDISYQDSPCDAHAQPMRLEHAAPKQPAQSLDEDNPDGVGLWQTTLLFRPRVSHSQPVAQRNLDELGDHGYFHGKPLTLVKCTDKSPIRERLRGACQVQVSRQHGDCGWTEQKMVGGTSSREVITISGNYRTDLTIKSDYTRIASHAPEQPVTNQSITRFRRLGACKPYMKEGDEFAVDDTGRPVPPR